MAYVSAPGTGYGSTASVIHADAAHSDSIDIPDAALLFRGNFHRIGSDLVLTGQDGHRHVVPGYFASEKHPALIAPNGAKLTGDLVDILSGSPTHGAYAQAQQPSPPGAIGKIEKVTGDVTVMRNGVSFAVHVGDPVYKTDVIQTGPNSSVGIGFPDGTALNLVANTRMALNDYTFDDNGTDNVALFTLVEGTFAFVAGKVAHTGSMKIATPVATMGIRGTTGIAQKVSTVGSHLGEVTYSFAVVKDYHSDANGAYILFASDPNGNLLFDPDGNPLGLALVSTVGQLTYITPHARGLAPDVRTEVATEAQLLFEQQIVAQVFQTLNLINNPNPQSYPGSPGSPFAPGQYNAPQLFQENTGQQFASLFGSPNSLGTGGFVQGLGTLFLPQQGLQPTTPGQTSNSSIFVWTSTTSGTWESGLNWSGNSVPPDGAIVEITQPVVVTIDGDETIDSLFVGSGSTLKIGANSSLTVSSIDNEGLIKLSASAVDPTLFVNGTLALTGGGEVKLVGTTGNILGVAGTNATLIDVDNAIIGSGHIGNGNGQLTLIIEGGSVTASGGILFLDTGKVIHNSAALVAAAGGTLEFEDNVINSGGGHITIQSGGTALLEHVTITGGTIGIAANGKLAGSGTITGTIASNGTIEAVEKLNVAGAITGTGKALIDSGATLELGSTDAQAVNFLGVGTFQIDHSLSGAYSGTIGGFRAGDKIDLADLVFSGEQAVWTQVSTSGSGSGTLAIYDGSTLEETLKLTGSFSTSDFVVVGDGSGKAEIELASEDEWINTSGGCWTNAANWSQEGQHVVPTAALDAIIDLAGTYTVTLSGDQIANSLTISDTAATLTGSGTLTVETLENHGKILVDGCGNTLTITELLGGSTNYGTEIARDGATLNVIHDGSATNEIGGKIEALFGGSIVITNKSGDVANYGLVQAAFGGTVSIDTTVTTPGSGGNYGTIQAIFGGRLSIEGPIFNASCAEIVAIGFGSKVEFSDGLVGNSGTILAALGGGVCFSEVMLGNFSGGKVVADGGWINFDTGGVRNYAGAEIEAKHSGTITFRDGIGVDNKSGAEIVADGPGSLIAFDGAGVINETGATIEAKHFGTVTFSETACGPGGIENGGTIAAAWYGTVNFFDIGGSDNGGIINTDGTIAALGWGSEVNFYDSTIIGGTLKADGGRIFVSCDTTLVGCVNVVITDGGLAHFAGPIGQCGSVDVTFGSCGDPGAGTLQLDAAPGCHLSVSGFGVGDTIDLTNLCYSPCEFACWTQNGDSGTLTIHDGGQVEQLTLNGSYCPSDFVLLKDPTGGTEIVYGAVDNWTSELNGCWTNSEDWSRGALGPQSTAEIEASLITTTGSVVTVTLDDCATVGNLVVGSKGELDIVDGGSLKVLNALDDSGLIKVDSTEFDPKLVIDGPVRVDSGGKIEANGHYAEVDFFADEIGNAGTLVAQWGGTMSFADVVLINQACAKIEALGGTVIVHVDDGSWNYGLNEAAFGGTFIASSTGVTGNSGTLEAIWGGTMFLNIGPHPDVGIGGNFGTIKAFGENSAVHISGGMFNGSGGTAPDGSSLGNGKIEALFGGAVTIAGGVINAFCATIDAVGPHATVGLFGGDVENWGLIDAQFHGTVSLAGVTYSGSGLLKADGGTLFVSCDTTLVGAVNVVITDGGLAHFAGPIGQCGSVDVTFGTCGDQGAGTLQLDAAPGCHLSVSGFGVGDTIDLTNLSYSPCEFACWTQNDDSGTLTIHDAGQVEQIALNGSYCPSDFVLLKDPTGGTEIVYGAVDSWTSDSSGCWTNSEDWSHGTPGSQSTAEITASGVVVYLDSAETVGNLVIGHNAELDIVDSGSLTVLNAIDDRGTTKVDSTDCDPCLVVSGPVTIEHGGSMLAVGDLATLSFCGDQVGNAGTIAAEYHGTVSFHDATVWNDPCAVIQATCGGTVQLFDVTLTNDHGAAVEAQGDCSVVNLWSSSISNDGTIGATWGGTVCIADSTVTQGSCGIISATGSDSTVDLIHTTISGGSVETDCGGVVQFDWVTVACGSEVQVVGNDSALTLDHHLDNQGTIVLAGTSSDGGGGDGSGSTDPRLVIDGCVTLTGHGDIVLSEPNGFPNVDYIVSGQHGGTLDNVDNTISGGGTIGDCNLTLTNESCGVIDANLQFNALTLETGTNCITNSGLLEATSYGDLVINSSLDNSCGTVTASTGGYVQVESGIHGGNAVIAAGTIEYDGWSNVATTFTDDEQGALVLGACSDFTGKVSGFAAGDAIDLKGIDFGNCTQFFYCASNDTLTVTDGHGDCQSIQLCGSGYSQSSFALFNDGTGHTAITVLQADPGADTWSQDAGSGHSYQFVSDQYASWLIAEAGAVSAGGHLATITSADENSFVTTLANGNTAWLGGSDEASEGTWQWLETGTTFWVGDGTTGHAENGNFTNWNQTDVPPEPNNINHPPYPDIGEHFLQMLSDGTWNDEQGPVVQSATTTDGYVIESNNVVDPAVVPGTSNVVGSIDISGPYAGDTFTATFKPEGSNYLGTFSLDAPTTSNGTTSIGFEFTPGKDQINLAPGQTLTQSYDVSVADSQHAAGNVEQTISVSLGGPGNDNFVFAPGIGTDTIVNFDAQHDAIELDHFANVQNDQQLAAAITSDAHGDAVIDLGHHDSVTVAGVSAAYLQAHVQNLVHLH